MGDVPRTTQRPLPSFLARIVPRLPRAGVRGIVAVSHVGAAQPMPLSPALRTRSWMWIGVVVFGNRNVSLELLVSVPRLACVASPGTWDHSYFAAPSEVEPSSVRGRFWST